MVEELAAVIGGHGADRAEGAFGDEAAEGAVDGLLADGAQRAQEDVAGAALEQDEESAAAGAPGDDAVHLPIAKALPGKDFRGALLDGPAAGEDFAAPGVAPTARLARTVAQTALGQDDDAVFEVVVDGTLRGEALPTLEAERVQAGGDGEASRKEGDETHGEEIGHHGAAAFGGVGLFGALLGQDGGILGVNPAAMDFVAQQDAGEPGLQLALQPTVRKTVKPREGTYAQCLAPTPHVLAPKFLQGDAPLIHPMFPNARKCATLSHVGIPL